MKIPTVNVIEITGDDFQSIVSFSEDDEGNREAEELFKKKAKENGASQYDMDAHLDDGCYLNGTYQLLITHSL